jgi:beta-glucosidase
MLEMFFPGTEGGRAAANLLFGRVNPSGKLSMSFPKHVGQIPVYYNRTMTGRPKRQGDDVFEGYTSSYMDCGILPLYFFGEGLSYTKFVYEEMSLDIREMGESDTLTVSVTVRNAGERAGKEVVQLYLRDLVSSTVRPVQELIAFEKIALEAGERRTVRFEISEPMLRLWNFENKFVSEKGDFLVSVGYADHMHFSEKFTLVK